MHILIILIGLNVLLLVIFRLFKTYNINTFQAIVFNYITCVIAGSILLGEFPLSTESIQEPWFPYSILLGLLFILGFNILGKTVQLFGVTLTSIAQKMSLVMIVSFTILFFQESVNFLKIIGILAAIASIILINLPKKGFDTDQIKLKKLGYVLFLTFLFSGIIEIILFYVEAKDYSSNADIGFIVALFGMAGILGIIGLIFGYATKKLSFDIKNVIAGITLGIPNFFTIYFLLVLINKGFEGSLIFPILNVSIILGSALLGYFVFKENLSKRQWMGFALGLLCIIFIAIS